MSESYTLARDAQEIRPHGPPIECEIRDRNGVPLAQRIADAELIGQADRLRLLRASLTTHRAISHYATLDDSQAQSAIASIDDALARLQQPIEKKRRQRSAATPPKAIEFSGLTAEQRSLFDDPTRFPYRPYCAVAKDSGLRIRSLQQALTHPYISVNPPHLRVWSVFDIDRPGAAGAWEDADLPAPAWAAVNRANGHAHLAWGLRAPVLVEGIGARSGPLRYLCAVESLMRERMGSDAGFSGLLTKNPAHPMWELLRGPRTVWDLGELAQYFPGLEKHIPKKRGDYERAGLGRNVSVFDDLRHWAYKAIRRYWHQDGMGKVELRELWHKACFLHALELNSAFPKPLFEVEVRHIARSVAKWTWKNCSEAGFRAYQSAQGTKGAAVSAAVRRAAAEDSRQAARAMREQGQTLRAIAASLGVSVDTARRWASESGVLCTI